MKGTIIRTPEHEGGVEIMHEVYVEDIAYGVRDGRVVLGRLEGIFDDGRTIDIDRMDELTPLAGPGDFAGHAIVWGCGAEDRDLVVEEFAYIVDDDGRVRLDKLRGILDDGGIVEYQRLGDRDDDCGVEAVDECVRTSEGCWGFCQGIIDCGCVGSGSCEISVKIKCVNNNCFQPGVCKYCAKCGVCWCDKRRTVCQNASDDLVPGSVACSGDEGLTVTANGHARLYQLDQPTMITLVDYGVQACHDQTGEGNPCNVYINIWDAPNFPSTEGAVLLDVAQDLVPDGTELQMRTVPMTGLTLPPGNIVLEIFNDNGTDAFAFWPGSNAAGQSGPSFLRADACGLPNWTDLAELGYPDVHLVLCFDAVTGAVLPWSEPFDAYEPGSQMHHQGGWKGWDNDPGAGAIVVPEPFLSPPNSVQIQGDSDLTHELTGATSGTWSCTAWQYIPADFQSGGNDEFAGTYFLLLNTYNDGGPYHWSVQMQFDSNDGMLKVYHGDGTNTIDLPYQTDRWVRMQALVDLDDDWTQVYYDDELVTEYAWTGGVLGDGGGEYDIAAVDLFGNGSTSVFYDDLAIERIAPPCPADFDDDGDVDTADLLHLLSAWGTPDGDVDGDGDTDTADLLALLGAWGECP
ncbi:MAG: hypothetical protein SYC29_15970 [Planctomycetota bacterium]|nr:hypothetical protein [Planctomycetota bacterium]